jgi:hypothetical protein
MKGNFLQITDQEKEKNFEWNEEKRMRKKLNANEIPFYSYRCYCIRHGIAERRKNNRRRSGKGRRRIAKPFDKRKTRSFCLFAQERASGGEGSS